LAILRQGIGRRPLTFANTIKYIITQTISANFGNMFSMAGASLLLAISASARTADLTQ